MSKANSLIGGIYSFFNKRKSLSIVSLILIISGIGALYLRNYSPRGKYYRYRENAFNLAKECLPDAKLFLNNIIKINPNDDAAYYYLGYSKLCDKQSFDAIYDFKKAIALNPNNPLAYEQMGNAKRNIKDFKGSISDYKKAIEINPKLKYLYGYIADAQLITGDYSSALVSLNTAIESYPNDPKFNRVFEKLYFNRAAANSKLKDYTAAISDYSKVLEINPKEYSALFYRGVDKINYGDNGGGCIDLHNTMQIKGNISPKNIKFKEYASQLFNEKCEEFFGVIDLIK